MDSYLRAVPLSAPAGAPLVQAPAIWWDAVIKPGTDPARAATFSDYVFTGSGIKYVGRYPEPAFFRANIVPRPPEGSTLRLGLETTGATGYVAFVIAADADAGNFIVMSYMLSVEPDSEFGNAFANITYFKNWQIVPVDVQRVSGGWTAKYKEKGNTIFSYQFDRKANTLRSTVSPDYEIVYKFPADFVIPPDCFGLPSSVGGMPVDAGTTVTMIEYNRPSAKLTMLDAPYRRNGRDATYLIGYEGTKGAGLEHRWVSPTTNKPLTTGWTKGVSVVSGNDVGTIKYTAKATCDGPLKLMVRYTNDTLMTATFDEITEFGVQGREPKIIGNMPSCNYFTPVPLINNWGRFSLQGGNGWFYIPNGGIRGVSILTTNKGISIRRLIGTDFGDGDTSHMEVLSSDAATGKHRIRFTGDDQGTHRAIEFTGPVTSIDVKLEGHENEEFNPEALAHIEDSGIRVLDMVGTNDIPVFGQLARNADVPGDGKFWLNGGFAGSYLPFSLICRFADEMHRRRPTFDTIWYPQPHDLTPAQIRAQAEAALKTDPNIKFIHEPGNEDTWNFNNEIIRLALGGISRGYYGAGTFKAPQPKVDISRILSSPVSEQNRTGSPIGGPRGQPSGLPAMGAEQAFLFNVYGEGNHVWRTLRAVRAGEPVVEGPNFKRLSYLMDGNPGRKFKSAFHKESLDIWKDVFGASFETRVIPVLMGQSVNGQRPDQQLKLELEFTPGYKQMLKGIGWAWYFSDQGLDPTDPTVTVDTLAEAYRADLPFLAKRIEAAYAGAKALGMQLWMYEGLSHYSGQGQPGTAFQNAQEKIWTTEKGKQLIYDATMIARLHASGPNAGGLAVYNALALGTWSLRKTFYDYQNPRYLGWKEAFATPLPL